MSTWRVDWKNMQNIFFEMHMDRPDKSENIYIFFQSTHQVDMKNVVECYKQFFGYFNALETNGV